MCEIADSFIGGGLVEGILNCSAFLCKRVESSFCWSEDPSTFMAFDYGQVLVVCDWTRRQNLRFFFFCWAEA